jgi:WhiB family redox-sensing transcriptional regulator
MTTAAKDVCARCDVREQCLEFALEHREVHGVWGGTSVHQRRDIRRDRLKSRAA